MVPSSVESFNQSGARNSTPLWSLGQVKSSKLTQNYKNSMKKLSDDDGILDDDKLTEFSFPRIELDKCLVVTDKNVYFVELR